MNVKIIIKTFSAISLILIVSLIFTNLSAEITRLDPPKDKISLNCMTIKNNKVINIVNADDIPIRKIKAVIDFNGNTVSINKSSNNKISEIDYLGGISISLIDYVVLKI